jgi:hypothetical protein
MTQFTFKTDDGLYDVEKLNDTAKTAFNYLAEVQSEIQTLRKRIDVLQAANNSFKDLMMENLDPDALIEEEKEEEES